MEDGRRTGDARRWTRAALAGATTALLAAAAGATPSVELFFTSLNGTPIAPTDTLGVLPGDEIGVEAVISTGDAGARAFDIFLDYDSAGTDRLLLEDASNVLPPPIVGVEWITQQNPGFEEAGRVRFSSLFPMIAQDLHPVFYDGLVDATYVFGRASLTVTDAILEGSATLFPDASIILGVTFDDVTEEFEEFDATASYAFGGLTLVAVPEPGTALLVGMGLLLLGGRRAAGRVR